MPIPKTIKKQHIESACNAVIVGQTKVPKNRRSTEHCLIYRGRHIAPKFVVSLAGKYANGSFVLPDDFSGGPETNGFLEERGFEIIQCGCGGLASPSSLITSEIHTQNTTELHTVARIICAGPPPMTVNKAKSTLLQAFGELWKENVRAKFTITPGGFISMPFPDDWNGNSGWECKNEDIEPLYEKAELIVNRILDKNALALAVSRTDFLTLGFDFIDEDEHISENHAELIAFVNLKNGNISWTGKSYPVGDQEDTLIHVASIESHFLEVGNERVLLLGCHDLNAYSNRARPKFATPRYIRQKEMREKAKKFNPTVVLHHPHSTDAVGIWPVAWAGVRQHLWKGNTANKTSASGIAWFRHDNPPRGSMENVLKTTKMGDVIDVVVK